jgi:hypothetical protein
MSATLVDANVLIDVLTEDERIEDLDEALPLRYYRRAELPWAAGFLAAKGVRPPDRALKESRARGTEIIAAPSIISPCTDSVSA